MKPTELDVYTPLRYHVLNKSYLLYYTLFYPIFVLYNPRFTYHFKIIVLLAMFFVFVNLKKNIKLYS